MPILRIENKNILFVHIPKTGGETIEHYLAQLGRLGCFWPKAGQGLYQCTPQHFDAEMRAPIFPLNFFDYSFTVVRHPLDRLISEYKMRINRKFIAGAGFPAFDGWFESVARKVAENPRYMDNHLKSQSSFIDETLKVFRFEDGIEACMQQVERDLGVVFDFSTKIHRQKPAAHINIDISEYTLGHVAALYESDFDKFGYKLADSAYFGG